MRKPDFRDVESGVIIGPQGTDDPSLEVKMQTLAFRVFRA